MQEIRAIARRMRPHRGLALLALVVFAATGYVACGGDDRVFGAGGNDSSADDVISVDTTADDTSDDTSDTHEDTSDTLDDTPSTND